MREMARLQTFPGDVRVQGGLIDAQRQLGNAVPSLLAEILAREINRQLLGRPPRTDRPSLAVTVADRPPPPPAELAPVPERYLELRGDHDDHPGTGRGYGALSRTGGAIAPGGLHRAMLAASRD